MSFEILDRKELRDRIIKKLKNGWVILGGDSDIIEMIEVMRYTPGYPESKDFEAFMHPSAGIYLAKKDELKGIDISGSPDLKYTRFIEFKSYDKETHRIDLSGHNTKQKEISKFVDAYLGVLDKNYKKWTGEYADEIMHSGSDARDKTGY